jgi:KDO2-lipid IV(A) lauroyltransferase
MRRWRVIHKIVLAAVLPLLRQLPRRLAHRLLGVMGRLDFFVLPSQRRLYEQAVADASSRLGCAWNRRLLARAIGRQMYRWRARDVLLDGLTERSLAEFFRVEGRANLDAALAEGNGVILLANHFGSHVIIAHWVFRQGYALRWFGERPRNISRFLKEQLDSEGPLGQAGLYVSRRTPMTAAASMIVRLARILREGMIVKIACDVRWRAGKVATAEFLGQRETFSSAWVQLAARTGAPVVPAFCRVDEAGTYDIEFQPALHVPPEAARDGRDAEWVQLALAAVESQVRRHPEQSNDYFFWTPADLNAPGAELPAPHHLRRPAHIRAAEHDPA